jgi:hypothetical protein
MGCWVCWKKKDGVDYTAPWATGLAMGRRMRLQKALGVEIEDDGIHSAVRDSTRAKA